MTSSSNPFEGPQSVAETTREPLPDVPAADVQEGPPMGNLVDVASAPTVIEAEMLRGRLVAAGIRVGLRDQFAIGTDPILSTALNGVKVTVGEADLARAREILAQPAAHRGPVFRVEQTSRGWSLVLGLMAGAFVGTIVASFVGEYAVYVSAAAGALIGLSRGSRIQRHCSNCQVELTLDAATCPRCGGTIAGVLDHPDQRLEAEEALRHRGLDPALTAPERAPPSPPP